MGGEIGSKSKKREMKRRWKIGKVVKKILEEIQKRICEQQAAFRWNDASEIEGIWEPPLFRSGVCDDSCHSWEKSFL
jgi:hypothetical protein